MKKLRKSSKNPYLNQAYEGARDYNRARHLPALLALWPSECEDLSSEGTAIIIRRLETALQSERRRGRAQHWCYDLNRHIALVSALKGEQVHLAALKKRARWFKIKA